MVAQRRFRSVSGFVLMIALVVAIGIWLVNRAQVGKRESHKEPVGQTEKLPRRGQSQETAHVAGGLKVPSPSIVAAINEARWPSVNKGHSSSPTDIFVASISAMLRGDVRTVALAMSESCRSSFLDGRSIDDTYFQTLPRMMETAMFQSPTLESFKAERLHERCRLIATLSSIRGKQKISEEITMELADSASGWVIEKYETRMTKREVTADSK